MDRNNHIEKIRALSSEDLGKVLEHNGLAGFSQEIVRNQLTGTHIFDKTPEEWKTLIKISFTKQFPLHLFLENVRKTPGFLVIPQMMETSTPQINQKTVESFKKVEENENCIVLNRKSVELFNKIQGNEVLQKRQSFFGSKTSNIGEEERKKQVAIKEKHEIPAKSSEIMVEPKNPATPSEVTEQPPTETTEKPKIPAKPNIIENSKTSPPGLKTAEIQEEVENFEVQSLPKIIPKVYRNLKPKMVRSKEAIYENIDYKGKFEENVAESLGNMEEAKPSEIPLPPRPETKKPSLTDIHLQENFEIPPEIDLSGISKDLRDLLYPPPLPERDVVRTEPNTPSGEYLEPIVAPPRRQSDPLPQSPANIVLRLDWTSAENQLQHARDGSYLYRVSTRDGVYCVLVIKTSYKVYQVPVIYKRNEYYLETSQGRDDEHINKFETLDLLTQFYQRNDLIIGEKHIRLKRND